MDMIGNLLEIKENIFIYLLKASFHNSAGLLACIRPISPSPVDKTSWLTLESCRLVTTRIGMKALPIDQPTDGHTLLQMARL